MVYDPEKQYREICVWLKKADNKKSLLDAPNKKISKLLKDGISAESVAECATQLGQISEWWANEFLKSLWEGSDKAAEHGSLMLDYGFWKIRILSERFDLLFKEDPTQKSPIAYLDVCPLMGLLLSCGRIDQAKWIARKLLTSSQNTSTSGWLSDTDYSHFISNLSNILSTDPNADSGDDVTVFDCGIYNGLFTDWSDDEALKNIITKLCDEYLERTDEKNEKKLGVLEFVSVPYKVLPVTVMAYIVLRHELGLATNLPSHELLNSKFISSFPPGFPPTNDEVLAKVIKAASEVFPNIASA